MVFCDADYNFVLDEILSTNGEGGWIKLPNLVLALPKKDKNTITTTY